MTDTTRAGEIDDSDVSQLIYDWNSKRYRGPVIANRAFELHDETLRDGIQNPSVVDPEIEDKLEILHMLEEIGVDTIDVGLPGAGQRAFNDVLRLCREIADQKMKLQMNITTTVRIDSFTRLPKLVRVNSNCRNVDATPP